MIEKGELKIKVIEGDVKDLKKVFAVQVVVPNSRKSEQKEIVTPD